MSLRLKTGTYKKLKGSAGSEGTDYQIKLLVYFLLEGFHNKGEFLLSTENEEAGIFDDVVYQTQLGTLLLQAKHTSRNITFEQLFPLKSIKGDFNLFKYLKTFPTIVNNFDIENSHVIICTNGKFNEEKINDLLNKETKADSSKYLKKESFDLMSYINNVEFLFFDSNQDPLVEFIFQNVSQKDVKLFLNKLILVTISDKDLDDGIESLIKKIDFNANINVKLIRSTIFNKVKMWFQSDKGTYLSKKNVLAYFSEIISQNYIQGRINNLSLIKGEYIKKLEKDDYPDSLNDNLVLLKIKKEKTYDLHEFKIYQLLLNNLMFSNNENIKESFHDQTLFVNPRSSENVTTRIIQTFEMPEYFYLIIPIFDLQTFNKMQHLIKNVMEVQKTKQYKKIIFIVDTEDVKNEINQVSPNIKNFAVNIRLSDFSKKIQNEILQRKIEFQGKKKTFQQMIDDKNVNLDDFIDEHTLLRLVVNKNKIIVNNNVKTYKEIPFYVERYFKKTDKTRESTTKYTEKAFSEHILRKCNKKFIVIFDSPGMGKSTILNKLEHLLRAEPYWVIKVNLADCTKMLWRLRKQKRELFALEEFLNLYQFSTDIELESKIFHIPENVVLLLDALDEISPDYTDLILNSLSSIAKSDNIRKIVITSRTHIITHFKEKNIEYEIFALVPFTEEESINLLSMFWGNELMDKNKFDKIKQFAKNLIDKLNKTDSCKEIKTLIGIPLQTKIIGDIFTKYCNDFLENSENTIELPEILNLNWLYDEFIKRKKEIYVEEKCNADGNVNIVEAVENRFEDAINEHIKQALKLEFPQEQHNFFKILDAPLKSQENVILKMGILLKSGNKIQFIHKTLSEYFATWHVCELILKNKISEEFLKYLVRSDFLQQNLFIKNMLENKFISHEFKNKFFNLKYDEFKYSIEYLIERQPEFILLLITESGYEKLLQMNCVETLHSCVGHKHTEMFFKKLNETKNISKLKDENGNTPLHFACGYNSKKIVELLINKGYPIDVRGGYGRTSLHYAAMNGNTTVVDLLIDKGHPIDVRNNNGKTPLHDAAFGNHKAIVEILIDRGHPIDVSDNYGQTPLHYAISRGNITIVNCLLDKGHPLDVPTEKGMTPLHYAAINGNTSIVELLLHKGHSIDVGDYNGKKPLQCGRGLRKIKNQ